MISKLVSVIYSLIELVKFIVSVAKKAKRDKEIDEAFNHKDSDKLNDIFKR